eukprot:TRINITY_DN21188_c0_g1_i1.p1 TRINITY_DN21188_c0_g1~~TRINITY_DN21188_c0_g1_i1.p1  ORF type:complete len:421 (+),score=96.92 TRINITY_DN21188_c0_g1_i1:3-1265(+)
MNITLTNGETFVTRSEGPIVKLLESFNSSLANDPSEPYNFVARKGLLLNVQRVEIIAPYDTLRITFQPDPNYNFYAPQEIINVTLPPVLLTSGFAPTPGQPLGFVIENSPGTVWISFGQNTQLTENMVREGTASFILVLKHDKWNLVDNTSAAVIERKNTFISAFRNTISGMWDQRSQYLLKPQSFVLLDPQPDVNQEQRLAVNIQQDTGYRLSTDVTQDSVQFYIPTSVLVSKLPPFSLNQGPNSFRFDIKAMGDITLVNTGHTEPEQSGDIAGLPGAKLSMSLTVKLNKDSWRAVDCRDVIRTGFSSNLPNAPHGFLAKLDSIVNPNGIMFTECGIDKPCEMTINMYRVSSYTIAPAQGAIPQPEIVTLNIPAKCVAFRIAPVGSVTMTIDLHPSEVCTGPGPPLLGVLRPVRPTGWA